MVWMRLSRKQIFQALQNQGGAPIPLCWVMAKLKKELILLYTPHPVEARGAQIHPFKVVSAGSRASWATQQQGDLTKLCEAGLITTTFEHTHTGASYPQEPDRSWTSTLPGINKMSWSQLAVHFPPIPGVSRDQWRAEPPHPPSSETE